MCRWVVLHGALWHNIGLLRPMLLRSQRFYILVALGSDVTWHSQRAGINQLSQGKRCMSRESLTNISLVQYEEASDLQFSNSRCQLTCSNRSTLRCFITKGLLSRCAVCHEIGTRLCALLCQRLLPGGNGPLPSAWRNLDEIGTRGTHNVSDTRCMCRNLYTLAKPVL